MQAENLGELKKWAADVAKSGVGGDEVPWGRAVELISKHFGVRKHEVAVLGLTSDDRFLRFLAPENLRAIGQIPLSSTTSLAARTARDQRPELVNHFSMVPHATVFEAVPLSESERSQAIHKIMSAPIMVGKKVVGVTQISRKGASAADAGPDFTHPQLRELKTLADVLGPCVVLSTIPTFV